MSKMRPKLSHIPGLLLIVGSPASGKTTLARILSRDFRVPLLSRDEVKQDYVHQAGKSHDELPDANRIASDRFAEQLREQLVRGPIIAEAAFQHEVWRSILDGLPQDTRFILVVCRVPADLAAARDRERRRADSNWTNLHGMDGVTAESVREWEAPRLDCPTLEVDTSSGYDPDLPYIEAWIRRRLEKQQ